MTASTESDPVVIIDKDNPAGYYWDVSPITTKVVYEYGRNRPFAYAEVTVKKAYFNSIDLYWGTAPSAPKDASGNIILPNVVLGETTIHVEAYGASYDMIIDNKDEVDDSITFKCYNKSYKLRSSIYLSSLTDIIPYAPDTSKVAFARDPANPLGTPTISNNRYYISYAVDDTTSISIVAIKQNDVYKVDYIEGTGTAIFKFIATTALGFEPENCVIDAGYSYNYGDGLQNEYTMSEMQIVKGSEVIVGEDTVKLRTGYLCWDIIKALGYLSNRWPFFYDKAYFVDYNESAFCMDFEEMRLDYGVDDEGVNLSYTKRKDENALALDIYHIVDSVDQGTTYVQSSQVVNSENHSETVSITDASKDIAGKEIVFPYPETYDSNVFSNAMRDTLTKKLAFERVATYFKPQDCVQFTISEMQSSTDSIDVNYIVTTFDDLPSDALNGQIGMVTDGVMRTFYLRSGDAWGLYQYATYNNTRDSRFDVYSVIDTLVDVQNNITMYNCPLSFVQLSWPECITQFTFGNPEFIDSAYQLAQQEQTSVNAIVEGTADISISDKQAAKIVVGNQTLSQLDDDRTSFTGLIMEKNRASELYRLAGYNGGKLQAYFDSQGRILSGNAEFGSGKLISGVMIDENGITIAGGGTDQYVPYTIVGDEYIVDANTYEVKAGASGGPYIKLDSNGLRTYGSDGTLRCSIDSDGYIIGTKAIFASQADSATTATSATKADSATTATNATNATNADNADFAYKAGAGYVVIDSSGLRTYSRTSQSSAYLQCSVGSDGMITAGQGAVKIGRAGLYTYDSGGNLQCKVGTDGILSAGGGSVSLDENGITIDSDQTLASFYPSLKFAFNSSNLGYFGMAKGPSGKKYLVADSTNIYLKGKVFADYDIYLPQILGGTRYIQTTGSYFDVVLSYGYAPDGFDDGAIYNRFVRIVGGYNSSTSATTTSVTFPTNDSYYFYSSSYMFAWCCSIRNGPGDQGNDYVSNISTTGMDCRHEAGNGFYWFAIGQASSSLS